MSQLDRRDTLPIEEIRELHTTGRRYKRGQAPQFALCHSDRPYHALNLCEPCYKKWRWYGYYNDPVKRERMNEVNKQWRQRSGRQHLYDWRAKLKREYGITEEEYNAMVAQQEGKCALAGCNETNLVIDHDHTTGKVRGLLCNVHNLALGMFKDDVDLLGDAIAYLGRD